MKCGGAALRLVLRRLVHKTGCHRQRQPSQRKGALVMSGSRPTAALQHGCAVAARGPRYFGGYGPE